ncbi:Alpha-protein kinase vwkA [Porphyridium purpureum]|uniref:Alpha-protein kinase vwkA n=1 Tax=Porphyridium purpureum TaxID=35688 RepID=A0A5J4YI46_PORPP|nr:Alpha-protein kinase vwkA [Porphyridium purpureum]|eukprot:POR8689..scf243_20
MSQQIHDLPLGDRPREQVSRNVRTNKAYDSDSCPSAISNASTHPTYREEWDEDRKQSVYNGGPHNQKSLDPPEGHIFILNGEKWIVVKDPVSHQILYRNMALGRDYDTDPRYRRISGPHGPRVSGARESVTSFPSSGIHAADAFSLAGTSGANNGYPGHCEPQTARAPVGDLETTRASVEVPYENASTDETWHDAKSWNPDPAPLYADEAPLHADDAPSHAGQASLYADDAPLHADPAPSKPAVAPFDTALLPAPLYPLYPDVPLVNQAEDANHGIHAPVAASTDSNLVRQLTSASKNPRNIFLLGTTGAGTSSLASFLVDGASLAANDSSAFHISHGIESDTKELLSLSLDFKGTRLNCVDTPGFSDSSGTDVEVLHEFKTFLSGDQSACAVLLVVDTSNPRVTPLHAKLFEIAVEVFGDDAHEVMGVVLTKWTLNPKVAKKRAIKGESLTRLVESQSKVLESFGISVPPPKRWFALDAEYDPDCEIETEAARTRREELLSWASTNNIITTKFRLQFDIERQELAKGLASGNDVSAKEKALLDLSTAVLRQVAEASMCRIFARYTRGSTRRLHFVGKPTSSHGAGKNVKELFFPAKVYLAFIPWGNENNVGTDNADQRVQAELARFREIHLDSVASMFEALKVGAVNYETKRDLRSDARSARTTVVVQFVPLDMFISALTVDLLIDSGAITMDTKPLGEGASRVVFGGVVKRGTPLRFECGSELVLKVMKRDLYAQGVRIDADERTLQMLCRDYSDAFNATFNLSKDGESLKVYFRLGSIAKCPIDVRVPDGGLAITAGEDMFVEMKVHGEYEKFNSNSGWTSESGSVPDFFSHWTWVHSKGEHIVCDLQGYRGKPGGPKLHGASTYFLFTDPVILSKTEGQFGLTDLGEEGMMDWFAAHRCNDFCMRARLSRPSDVRGEPKQGSRHRMRRPVQ